MSCATGSTPSPAQNDTSPKWIDQAPPVTFRPSHPMPRDPHLTAADAGRRRFLHYCLALMVVTLPAPGRPAAATGSAVSGMIALIGRQSMIIQKIFKEMLLVALGIERQENLAALRRSREQFDATLAALRHDQALRGLRDDEVVRAKFEALIQLWPPFDDMILSGITASQVSHNLVDALAELDPLLTGAADATLESLVERAKADKQSAGLARSLSTAAVQRTLTQKMAKEFLLVAYRYEAEANRKRLLRSYETFDQILRAMRDGDPERRLIPAPTRAIRAKLAEVELVWRGHLPIMRSVVEGTQPERDMVAEVARSDLHLLRGTEEVFSLYAEL